MPLTQLSTRWSHAAGGRQRLQMACTRGELRGGGFPMSVLDSAWSACKGLTRSEGRSLSAEALVQNHEDTHDERDCGRDSEYD
jgi:hypothetical protein